MNIMDSEIAQVFSAQYVVSRNIFYSIDRLKLQYTQNMPFWQFKHI
jgi:hypothetical protein